MDLQIGKDNAKVVPAKKDARSDHVPIDYVVDTILGAAWRVNIHRDNKVKMYNCASNVDSLK